MQELIPLSEEKIKATPSKQDSFKKSEERPRPFLGVPLPPGFPVAVVVPTIRFVTACF